MLPLKTEPPKNHDGSTDSKRTNDQCWAKPPGIGDFENQNTLFYQVLKSHNNFIVFSSTEPNTIKLLGDFENI